MDSTLKEHREDEYIETLGGHVKDTYAVDNNDEQITVLGTMGQDPDEKQTISWRTYVILLIFGLMSIQNTFIGIAPAANSYAIAGALNGMDKRIWIVQAQAVPSIATGPIFSIIADLYGRRWIMIGAFVMYSIGAILGMVAQDVTLVIIGQTFTGVAAGVSGLSFALGSEVVPSIYRSHVQTYGTVVGIIGAVLALIASGAAANADPANGWRWIFRMFLIQNGVIVLGLFFFYRPPPRTANTSTLLQKLKALDWIGYFLLLAGLIPLLMGLAWSGDSNYGWHDKHAYVPTAVGGIMFIACILYEWKGTSRGFMDHRLFQNGRNFPLALLIIAVEGSLFYLINNIYASQAVGLWGTPGQISSNARILPFFAAVTVLGPFMSYYVTKRKDVKWPICAGFSFFSICIIGLALAGRNGNLGLVFNAIGGIGFAAPLILLITIVQLSTPPLFMGTASALTISARTLGGSVSLAIANAIYASKTTTQIPAAIVGTALSLGFNPQNLTPLIIALLSGQGIPNVPGITPEIISACTNAYKDVEAAGYKIVWFAFLPGTIIAAILCVFLKNPSDRMNWVTDAPLQMKSIPSTENGVRASPREDELESK